MQRRAGTVRGSRSVRVPGPDPAGGAGPLLRSAGAPPGCSRNQVTGLDAAPRGREPEPAAGRPSRRDGGAPSRSPAGAQHPPSLTARPARTSAGSGPGRAGRGGGHKCAELPGLSDATGAPRATEGARGGFHPGGGTGRNAPPPPHPRQRCPLHGAPPTLSFPARSPVPARPPGSAARCSAAPPPRSPPTPASPPAPPRLSPAPG